MQNRVKTILEQSLSATLKHCGFKKAGDLCSRKTDDVTQMIEVQRSRWNDHNQMSFTLNCGIHVPGVTSMFRRIPEPRRPKLADCCVTARVGMLGASKLDTWWTLSSGDERDRDAHVAEEVVLATTDSVLPFLDRFPSGVEVARFLSEKRDDRDEFVEPRPPAMRYAYAALLWARLGNMDKAKENVRKAENESRGTPLEGVVAGFVEEWERR